MTRVTIGAVFAQAIGEYGAGGGASSSVASGFAKLWVAAGNLVGALSPTTWMVIGGLLLVALLLKRR